MKRCWVGTLSGALSLSASFAGAQQSPLPAPTGAYSVGRTQFDWVDDSTVDPENRNGHREIVVWTWYPAAARSGSLPAEWMPDAWGELFWTHFVTGQSGDSSGTKERFTGLLRTHAFVDAPVATGRMQYPVLLFAPGHGETPLDYSSLIEDIASHGYIVAAVVPTYFSRETVFSDGRVVRQREITTIPGISRDPVAAIADAVRMWSRDLSFTLSQLVTVNADARSFLKGHFDFDHVGTFGHSLGGAAAAQFAHDDPRVRAVVSIDGSPFWNAANRPLDKPLLVLSAATSAGITYDRLLGGARPAVHLRLAGSGHTFSNDLRLIPRLQRASSSASASTTIDGSIDPARAHVVAKAYIEAFFGQYLDGKPSALLNGPSRDYPEISFERGSRSTPR